jgi:hypothetical protein
MRLRKLSLALATVTAALAGVSTFDSASAQRRATGGGSHQDRVAFGEQVASGQRVVRSNDLAAVVSDAPQVLRAKRRDLVTHGRFGAVSRPSTRDITDRGMRGGGRMNGGIRGRR